MLNYLRSTKTEGGLTVRAELIEKEYVKGQKVTDEEMTQLNISPAAVFPNWNYTIGPRELRTRKT